MLSFFSCCCETIFNLTAQPQQRVFGIATAGVQKEKKAGSGKGGNADAEAVMAPRPSVSPDQVARQTKATAAKAGAPHATTLHKGTEQGTGPAATIKSPVVAGSAGAVKHADVRHEVCTTMCRCSILDSSSDVLSTMRTPFHLAGVTTTLCCAYGPMHHRFVHSCSSLYQHCTTETQTICSIVLDRLTSRCAVTSFYPKAAATAVHLLSY